MEKFVIDSTCIAMTDNAASFNVLIKERVESSSSFGGFVFKDLKPIAEGNILINSNFRCNSSLTFYSTDHSTVTITDMLEEHCAKRAFVIFRSEPQQKK